MNKSYQRLVCIELSKYQLGYIRRMNEFITKYIHEEMILVLFIRKDCIYVKDIDCFKLSNQIQRYLRNYERINVDNKKEIQMLIRLLKLIHSDY